MQPHCTTPSKTCSKCGQTKPTTEFYRNKKAVDGLLPTCKACDRAYYEAHKEREVARRRAYRKALKENRYARRPANLEAARQREKAWHATHPEAVKASAARYRSRTHGGDGGTLTANDILAQLLLQSGRCHWCGECLDAKYHIDHVTPLARGGENSPNNLVIACPSCNCSRKSKLPDEWMP